MNQADDVTRAPMRVAFSSPALRRCQLASAVARVVDAALLVTVSVHVFGRGGAAAVAAFGVVRALVPAVGTPIVTAAAPRWAPGRALAGCTLVGAAGTAVLTGLTVADGSVVAIIAVSGVVGIFVTALRPLVAALLPRYIREPAALVATNSASAMVDSLGVVVGPLLAGVALATVGAGWVLGVMTVGLVVTAGVLVGLGDAPAPTADGERPRPVRDAIAGLRDLTVWPMRLAMGLGIAQTAVRGAVNVLVVSLAIERLDLGDGGVGLLLGAIGVGGFVGLPVAVRIARPGRMWRALGLAITLWGAPLIGVGMTGRTGAVLVLFAVVGLGNTMVDITVETLFQRLVPARSLSRALGAVYAAAVGGSAIGAVAGERLLSAFGLGPAIIVVGLVLPLAALASAPVLRRLDQQLHQRDADVALLQLDGIFSPLVLSTIDHLARSARTQTHPRGSVIVAEGDAGDSYYLIEHGEVDVLHDGVVLAVLAQGDGFGELSLLDGAPRNATVVATTEVRTRSIDGEDFLTVVGGDHEVQRLTDRRAAERRRRA